MKSGIYIFLFAIIISLPAIQSCNNPETGNSSVSTELHKVIVTEVFQSSEYTYLHVKEGKNEQWLAAKKMAASPGETWYYKEGSLVMKNFESKELKRTFDEIIIPDMLSATADFSEAGAAEHGHTGNKALVLEVLQTTQYTYLRVKTGEEEQWLAVLKMEAKAGETYLYEGGLTMTDFASKELNRIFDKVLFLDNIIKEGDNPAPMAEAHGSHSGTSTTNPNMAATKQEISIAKEKGYLTIGELYKNKKSYSGKTIRIKGKVTKFSTAIMKKNWIHLQDGTEDSGKFDLTITTDAEVKTGEIISLEGIITLDKDFGFGYFYEVLMEEAKLIK